MIINNTIKYIFYKIYYTCSTVKRVLNLAHHRYITNLIDKLDYMDGMDVKEAREMCQNLTTECATAIKALLDNTTATLNGLKSIGIDMDFRHLNLPSKRNQNTDALFSLKTKIEPLVSSKKSSGSLHSQKHGIFIIGVIFSFWRRWRTEYLHQLQARQKWTQSSVPVKVGTVVITINDNSPTLSWPLGVIIKVHPSKDGIVRVATLKTARGTLVRPVVRLCPLPTQ
ncbi:unnamed protein product [Parnassius mnemosyne]|uniref:DUF5641 domain-containing protein n=1 Tax=Parnassius mnemosyne TaxID=213953 RepID=A0AAV1KTT3_9NEOP